MKNSLVDGLALGGYWNDFCFVCQEQTYQPEGFCSVCGWNDSIKDYMTESEYKKSGTETLDIVLDRVFRRGCGNRIFPNGK